MNDTCQNVRRWTGTCLRWIRRDSKTTPTKTRICSNYLSRVKKSFRSSSQTRTKFLSKSKFPFLSFNLAYSTVLFVREFRRLFTRMKFAILSRFNSNEAVYKALGGFLFLRFICPAITAPGAYGILEGKYSTVLSLSKNGNTNFFRKSFAKITTAVGVGRKSDSKCCKYGKSHERIVHGRAVILPR